ncbi:S-layer protein SlpA [Clostridioides difficile]|uniref:S-layer protein SlpA n=1 Tax=Clostridioides difficile TaxID=1496 RepID=UPI0009800CBF|nr:S-layer protein SlpA [Clostridioides difficile]SJQ97757.1 N-acetylmuramoyl-L-alanine amidase LytC precursor [Clostridioides difficile]
MNKKNIAIAMSGLTVLASAAPVFAATDLTTDQFEGLTAGSKASLESEKANIKGYTVASSKASKVKDDLKKVVDNHGTVKAVYKEMINDNEYKVTKVLNCEDSEDFDAVKAKMNDLDPGEFVDFIVGGQETVAPSKYKLSDLTVAKLNAELAAVKGNALVDDKGNSITLYTGASDPKTALTASNNLGEFFEAEVVFDTDNVATATIKPKAEKLYLAANATTDTDALAFNNVELKEGTTKLDFGSLNVDSAGKTIAFNNVKATTQDSAKKYVRVVKATDKTVNASSDDDVASLAKSYVFNEKDLQDAIDSIDDGTVYKNDDGDYQVILFPEGKRLQLGASTYGAAKDSYVEGQLASGNTPIRITLKSGSKSTLKDALDDLKTANNTYKNTSTVAGEDRIETAIAISQKYYNSNDDAAAWGKTNEEVNNVVLVGANAIVDGLVASPLAAEKEAPLLLTSKDKLDSSVKSEIKRVMNLKTTTGVNNKKKVYIAGGENSVSKDVEKELKDMGVQVTRLSGDDRYETSLKIADEIDLNDNKAFVVGGTGLADAMSIAPVASYMTAHDAENATPIIVVDGKAKDISEKAQDFLGDAETTIIGGVNSVSKDVESAIEDATGEAPDRVKGDDRQDTNAEVIKKYYETKDNGVSIAPTGAEDFFVAKDGSTKEDQLVDALAVASVAGSKHAPILLATDSLSSDQSVAISKVKSTKTNPTLTVTQVGKGIASSVINKVKDLLDM